ncbi:MAG TPA: NADH-quinone oxidoreductase subunit A, partial [Acidimicrobiales bacterium]|nr:NADH-quinone oxidoreductase subunit A [Acidimicrobiales bacterium]
MDQYLPLLVMFVLAVGFVVLSLVTSKLMAPGRPTPAKEAPYECGIVPTRGPARRFPVRFYLVAMIFIVFDIEIIFLFPWAVIHRELGLFGLWAVVAFIVPFFLSFLWEIAEGGLDWGPLTRTRSLGALGGTALPPSSSVRVVGLEGRSAPPGAGEAEREEVGV